MIRILDLCSGIGGFSLGLEATGGFETVAFCEFDEFCCKVLNKHWPNVPIYNDLKELGNDPRRIIQEFDLICGGIPCQPFSVAGKKKGKEDDRHLWPFMYEIVKHKKPTWVIVENVGGFVNVALDDVCLDLEAQGYATQSFVIPACSVEAPHRRDRIWILGKYTSEFEKPLVDTDSIRPHEHKTTEEESSGRGSETSTTTTSNDVADPKRVSSDSISDSGSNTKTESKQGKKTGNLDRSSGRQDVAYSNSKGLQGSEEAGDTQESREEREQLASGQDSSLSKGHTEPGVGGMADGLSARLDGHFGFEVEPEIPRVATGIPDRVNRLKALGNSIVPQIIRNIGLAILEEEQRDVVKK